MPWWVPIVTSFATEASRTSWGNNMKGHEIVKHRAAMAEAKRQENLQREFAQNGIRWRVEDARAAGIHPLAALGASGASYTPVSVGDYGDSSGANYEQMGQQIMGAFLNKATQDERSTVMLDLAQKRAELDVEGAALQNALLGKRLLDFNNAPPPLPSNSDMPILTGQGNSYVKENPMERTHSAPGRPAQEVGSVTDFGFARTPTGLAIVPSKDVKEKIEDQLIPEIMWAVRNQILPNFSGKTHAPDPKQYPLPKGFDRWTWDHLNQEYRPSRGRGRAHPMPGIWE